MVARGRGAVDPDVLARGQSRRPRLAAYAASKAFNRVLAEASGTSSRPGYRRDRMLRRSSPHPGYRERIGQGGPRDPRSRDRGGADTARAGPRSAGGTRLRQPRGVLHEPPPCPSAWPSASWRSTKIFRRRDCHEGASSRVSSRPGSFTRYIAHAHLASSGAQGRGLRARRRHGQAPGVSAERPSRPGVSVGLWALAGSIEPPSLGLALHSPLVGSRGLLCPGADFSFAVVLPAENAGSSFLADLYLGRSENLRFFEGRVDAKMFLYLVGATMLALNLLSFLGPPSVGLRIELLARSRAL